MVLHLRMKIPLCMYIPISSTISYRPKPILLIRKFNGIGLFKRRVIGSEAHIIFMLRSE